MADCDGRCEFLHVLLSDSVSVFGCWFGCWSVPAGLTNIYSVSSQISRRLNVVSQQDTVQKWLPELRMFMCVCVFR